MSNEAEGTTPAEGTAEGREQAKETKPDESSAADDDFEMVSEDTPLMATAKKAQQTDETKPSSSSGGGIGGGKSYNTPVIKMEEDAPQHKIKVTTTEVTDEGRPPKNFVQQMQGFGSRVGKKTIEITHHVGKKTKEITHHVGGETQKLTRTVGPNMVKFGDNVGKSTRQLTDHVGKESKKVAETVTTSTRQLSDHVNRESQKIGQRTSIIAGSISQSTKPIVDNVTRESRKLAHSVTASTKEQYDKIAPLVEPHAKRYWGLVNGLAPDLMTTDDDGLVKQVLDGTARGYGRVVLCDNSFSGSLIGLALLISSPLAFLCSLYCAGLANYTAAFLDLDRSMMRRGHFASNAVLFGSGIATYLSYDTVWDWLTLLLVGTLGAPVIVLAYLLTARILTKANTGIPTLLFPYVGTMVVVLLGSKLWRSTTPAIIDIVEADTFHFVEAAFKGVSQIFILDNAWSGLLVFLGMMTCSRILAAATLLGSILGALFGLAFFDVPVDLINAGLLGFNSALSCAALLYFLVPTWKSSLVVGILGVLMTLGVQVAFEELFLTWSLPVMVFPFCLAILPVVALDFGAMNGVGEEPFIKVVPLDDLTTPEDHYRRSCIDPTYTEIPDVNEEEAIEENDEVDNDKVEAQKDEEIGAEDPKEEAGDDIVV